MIGRRSVARRRARKQRLAHRARVGTAATSDLHAKQQCGRAGSDGCCEAGAAFCADAAALKLFTGKHPQVVQAWLPKADGIFQANPAHKLSAREKKHRRMMWVENTLGLKFNKKHYHLVR